MDDNPTAPVDDVTEALAQLDLPTLIYNGDHDHPDFLEEAGVLARLLPRAQCWTVPNAGGFPAWERPVSVNAQVDKFLSQVLREQM